jgi:hypothetical protein
MKVDHGIEAVARAERELAEQLERMAERHATEHDVSQLGHTQALKAAARARRLEPLARTYGAELTDPGDPSDPGVVGTLRRKASELTGRSSAPGLLLLDDLQEVYLAAQRAEIAWIVLLQAGHARRDAALVATVTAAHEECEVTGKWLRTRIKVTAPQVLAVG